MPCIILASAWPDSMSPSFTVILCVQPDSVLEYVNDLVSELPIVLYYHSECKQSFMLVVNLRFRQAPRFLPPATVKQRICTMQQRQLEFRHGHSSLSTVVANRQRSDNKTFRLFRNAMRSHHGAVVPICDNPIKGLVMNLAPKKKLR